MQLSFQQCEEIPQKDQHMKSSGSWPHSWVCTERLCRGTHWCLHKHFQHHHKLQSYHHHSSPEEVVSLLLQWLPSICIYSHPHEVLWTASHAPHQVCPLPSLPVCILAQPLNRWTHCHCPPLFPHTSGQKRLICRNAVHRLQFSIQHNHPSTAHSQIGPAEAQHLAVQLAVELSDWETSGSMGRQ